MNYLLDLFKNNLLVILVFLSGICVILAILVLVTSNISRSRKTAVFMLEMSSLMMMISIGLCHIFEGRPGQLAYWLAKIGKLCDSFFTLMSIFSLNLYLKDLIKYNGGRVNPVPDVFRRVDLIVMAALSVLIAAECTGLYYPMDESNHYVRTWERYVNYALPLLAILTMFFGLIKHRKKVLKFNFVLISCVLVSVLASSAVQLVTPGVPLGSLTTVDMAILLYIFEIYNLGKEVERAHRLEIEMMERYQKELEVTVDKRTHELRIANEKAERLLLNILPEPVAKELTEHPGKTISQKYPNATVLFTDIVGFTKMSSSMTAEETVSMLNGMTSLFDERAAKEGIEKIKTIGDAYMAVSGLTDKADNNGAVKMIRYAMGLLDDVRKFNLTSKYKVQIRVGINCGNLVAGVIGKTKFIYDVWGDTVNVASRMESSGESMMIHVSEAVYEQAKNAFKFQGPIPVDLKGKGVTNGYFLLNE
ncbi:MAG: adenylate/guanylate cyclase domain-containing protein [Treponema sp.]|nr:adenylate/guanylate cyclase domain-containing protein [Treponema sp.]